jgi:hypothetical protein
LFSLLLFGEIMTYSAQYRDFSADKQHFFSDALTARSAKVRANGKDYVFLANNHLLIEQEFNQLFASLKKQSKNNQEFWLYCIYCCDLLRSYYTAYNKQDKAEYYRSQLEKLKARSKSGGFLDNDVRSLKQKIAADLGVLASTPVHIAKIRDWVAFANIYRLHFTFCRLTVRQSLLLASELKWLEKLDQMLGTHMDVNGMVSRLNAPAALFNLLSVGLFAARLIINAGLLLKHTFLPATEQECLLGVKKRFYQEVYARHCVMINDAVWGATNLLTNYRMLFNISAPFAAWLTAGLLVFDVSWLFYGRRLAKAEYRVKEAQYRHEKNNYELLMQAASIGMDDMKKYQKHCQMLDKQLDELRLNEETANAKFLFNILAAVLLTTGFTTSLLLATPVAVIVSYFVIVVGVAMYFSAGTYGAYKEKSLILQQHKLNSENTDIAQHDKHVTRNALIITMAKNIIIPMLIVTALAVCWEAALLITALYIGYECLHGYFQGNPPANTRRPLRLVSANNDEGEEMDTLVIAHK